MFDDLSSVLDTRGTSVFRHTENANQHEEFRPKVLSFLSLGALGSIPDHSKTTPSFLHSKPFLDDQVNEVRCVATLKRKPGRTSAPDERFQSLLLNAKSFDQKYQLPVQAH